MELELLFENRFAKVKYDRENGVIRASYHGIVNTDLGIESFQALLDILPQTPIKGAIFNCMEMEGTFTQLNPWLNSTWYPALIPQGYVCWAMSTTDVFTRFAGSLLINTLTPKEITANIFKSTDKAEDWVYQFLNKTADLTS